MLEKTLNQKGQEEAPFELLVAVIIMGFVIFIGLQAMVKLNEERCYNETDASLEGLKKSVQIIANQGIPQSVSFHLATCYNPEEEKIWLKEYNDPNLCADYCGAQKNLCILLQYFYSGENSFAIRKCVEISPDTVFPSAAARCPNREEEGYELIDFKEAIPRGNYQLRSRTDPTSIFPTVCAYRQKE